MAKKSKTANSGKDRSVSHEEAGLWQTVTDGIKPLSEADRDKFVENAPPPISTAPTVEKRGKPQAPQLPQTPQAPVKPRNDSPPATDRRTARALKKGKTPIEARLDLHGMTQDEAHMELSGFIEESQNRGRRCVLVITGKGRSGPEPGVLRSAVPRWLGQPPNREKINSFSQAAPRDGGEGALYILLKKKR